MPCTVKHLIQSFKLPQQLASRIILPAHRLEKHLRRLRMTQFRAAIQWSISRPLKLCFGGLGILSQLSCHIWHPGFNLWDFSAIRFDLRQRPEAIQLPHADPPLHKHLRSPKVKLTNTHYSLPSRKKINPLRQTVNRRREADKRFAGSTENTLRLPR